MTSGYDKHQSDARHIAAACAVLTLSDTRTPDTDKSGRRIRELIETDGHVVAHYQVMPDDPMRLKSELERLLSDQGIHAILTNGGTGISRRDQTISVIEQTIEIPLPGFGELFRMLSWQQIGSGAMLSRAAAGIARGKPIFALPGSTAAVELAVTKLILPQIRHLLGELRK
jgi:molybdopterin adenylyltransferase